MVNNWSEQSALLHKLNKCLKLGLEPGDGYIIQINWISTWTNHVDLHHAEQIYKSNQANLKSVTIKAMKVVVDFYWEIEFDMFE